MSDGTPLQGGQFELKRSRRPLWLGLGAIVVAAIVVVVILLSTGSSTAAAFGPDLKIAWDTNPQEQEIINYVNKNIAPSYGIKLTPVEFGDANTEYRSISDHAVAGALSAQRWWMLTESQGLGLKPALDPTNAYAFLWASGVYSLKYKSLSQIPDGATVEIPQEPSTQAQQLGVMQDLHLIKLNPKVSSLDEQVDDIVSNPKHLKIEQIALNSMARVLPDFAAAFSCNSCQEAGYGKDEIASVPLPATYAVPLTIASDESNNPWLKKAEEAFSSPKLQVWLRQAPPAFKQVVEPAPTQAQVAAATAAATAGKS